MKKALTILFTIISISVYSQIPFESELKFKNGVAFKGVDEYTGKAYRMNYDKKCIIVNYYNGKLDGKVIEGDEIIYYQRGLIKSYTLNNKNIEVLSIDNSDLKKSIYKIKIGILFKYQHNDTLFFPKDLSIENDSLDIELGVFLYKKTGETEFIPLSNIKIKNFRMSAKFGAYFYEEQYFGYKVPYSFFKFVKPDFYSKFYVEDIHVILPNGEEYCIGVMVLNATILNE